MELKQCQMTHARNGCILLIVPYGIETWRKAGPVERPPAFNRTLWN